MSRASRGATAPATPALLRWVTGATLAGAFLLTSLAFKLSFESLSALASMAGIRAADSWIWPLIIDGLIVVATLAIVALAGYGRRALIYPWTLLFGGAAASIVANSEHAILTADGSVPAAVSVLVASAPPVVMLAATHLAVALVQRASRAKAAAMAQAVAERELETAPAGRRVSTPTPAFVPPAPAPVAAAPAPARSRPAAPGARPRTAPTGSPTESAEILTMRHAVGPDGKRMSEQKIADTLGVSKSRVHRIVTAGEAGEVTPDRAALPLVDAIA
jgi:DNA-binding transcriptional regulator YiaG